MQQGKPGLGYLILFFVLGSSLPASPGGDRTRVEGRLIVQTRQGGALELSLHSIATGWEKSLELGRSGPYQFADPPPGLVQLNLVSAGRELDQTTFWLAAGEIAQVDVHLSGADSGKLVFSRRDSLAALSAGLYLEILGRRAQLSSALKDYRESGRPLREFQFDWEPARAELRERIQREENRLLRAMLMMAYLDIGYGTYGAQLEPVVVRRILDEVPPDSALWSLERELLGIALDTFADPALFNAYVERMIGEHPDRELAEYVASNYGPDRRIMPGKIVPDFSLPMIAGSGSSGGNVSAQSLRGKIVLIDFWATWCKPCIEEMENLHLNHQRYANRGFEILSLSIDEQPELVTQFRTQRWPMPWINVFLEGQTKEQVMALFEVKGLPRTLLIDRSGKILTTGYSLRGARLEKTLLQAFEANPSQP